MEDKINKLKQQIADSKASLKEPDIANDKELVALIEEQVAADEKALQALEGLAKAEEKVEVIEAKVEVAETKVEEVKAEVKEAETPAAEKKAEVKVEAAKEKVEEVKAEVKEVKEEVKEAKVEVKDAVAVAAAAKAEVIKHGGARPNAGRRRIEGREPRVRGAHGGHRPNAGRKRKSRLPSRTIDLNQVKENDAQFCSRVISEWRKRRAKAKTAAKKHRKKTISSIIVERVASAVEKGIESVPSNVIKANPAQFKTKAVRLERSAKTFLRDFKSLLGDAIKQRDIDSEFKDVEAVINKLVSRFKK